MKWFTNHPGPPFLLKFVVLFTVLLTPIPWLADGYCTVYCTAGNGILSLMTHTDDRFQLSLEPPESIRAQGSWSPTLRVVDWSSGAVATPKLSVRTFSYLPIALYLALAVASRHGDWRRWVKVLGAGMLLMTVITLALSALPVLDKFAALGALGPMTTPVVETLYQALATPIILYAIPLVLWWVLVNTTRTRLLSRPLSGSSPLVKETQ